MPSLDEQRAYNHRARLRAATDGIALRYCRDRWTAHSDTRARTWFVVGVHPLRKGRLIKAHCGCESGLYRDDYLVPCDHAARFIEMLVVEGFARWVDDLPYALKDTQ